MFMYLPTLGMLRLKLGNSSKLTEYCAILKRPMCKNNSKTPELPPEPTTCCMSGCANCVWIAYAQEIAQILDDGGDAARAKIIEKVSDPNLRAFLLLELHSIQNKCD